MIQSGADAIRPAWFGLAAHARACEQCRPGMLALQAVPDDPRRADFEGYEGLCQRGQELFTAWRGAKDEWLEGTRAQRRKQFIMEDQFQEDGVSFELRSLAIMSMPANAFQAWLELPDDERHHQLRALEQGLRFTPRTHVERSSALKMHRCQGCGREIPSRTGRFCSPACRISQAQQSLTDTENPSD